MKNTIMQSEDYCLIAQYAQEQALTNTMTALETACEIMTTPVAQTDSRFGVQSTHTAYLRHALSVCRILIELHIPLCHEEEDILLASSLCHIFPETILFPDFENFLTQDYSLHPEVFHTISILFREHDLSEEDQKKFFDAVRKNKLALILKLADRGNLTQQIYSISDWEAHKYIRETKEEFFPMCIYAKEHYPELLGPVSVLMEKIRCLTDVADILLSRYEQRVSDLSNQILAMQEENAAMRRIIQTLKSDQ